MAISFVIKNKIVKKTYWPKFKTFFRDLMDINSEGGKQNTFYYKESKFATNSPVAIILGWVC